MQLFLQIAAFSLQTDGSGWPVLTKRKRPKIHFFRYKNFFKENCRSNLIANIIFFGFKIFFSRSGGSFKTNLPLNKSQQCADVTCGCKCKI